MIKLAQKSLSLIAAPHAISSRSISPFQSLSNFKHISAAPIFSSQLTFTFSKQKKCLTNLDKLTKMKREVEVMSALHANTLRLIDQLIKQAEHCEKSTICLECKNKTNFRRPCKLIKQIRQSSVCFRNYIVDYLMFSSNSGCYKMAMKNFSKTALTPSENQLHKIVRLPKSSLKWLKK